MKVQTKIGVIGVVLALVALSFAASAYTTGSVDRQSTVNVVNDDAGLIALQDGTSGDLVKINSSGALEIDFTSGGAGGVNTEAKYELGNPSDPTNQTAFNISNQDAESHDISLSYSGSDSEDADANIQFQVYDSTGASVVTASEESGTVSIPGAASGSTYHVVLVVDTYGLTSNSDLSGTLTVSA